MIRITMIALALMTTTAMAQTSSNAVPSPETNDKSYTPTEQLKAQGQAGNTQSTSGNQAYSANSADMCSQWSLKNTDLTDCHRQWSSAKSDSDRQKLRARYEPNYNGSSTGNSPAYNPSTGQTTKNGLPTNQTQSPAGGGVSNNASTPN